MNLPSEFIKRLQDQLPLSAYTKTYASFNIKTFPTIRANTLVTATNNLEKCLHRYTIEYAKDVLLPDTFLIKNKTSRDLTDLDEYKRGFFYIQNPASILSSLILNPRPNEIVLDMAAAPGSKTIHMAALMKNTGTIIANDISAARLLKLHANIRRYGVQNVKTVRIPGERLWQKYPEFFDRVLLDAPCSMEGLFKACDEKTFSHWSTKKVKFLAKKQRWLLRSAISALKPGGSVVYSTCTFAPEENEAVVDWVLEKEKGKIEVEKMSIESPQIMPGLTSWRKKSMHASLSLTKRIIPDEHYEGFYIAKIRKLASTV